MKSIYKDLALCSVHQKRMAAGERERQQEERVRVVKGTGWCLVGFQSGFQEGIEGQKERRVRVVKDTGCWRAALAEREETRCGWRLPHSRGQEEAITYFSAFHGSRGKLYTSWWIYLGILGQQYFWALDG